MQISPPTKFAQTLLTVLVGLPWLHACDNGTFKETGKEEKKVVSNLLPQTQQPQLQEDTPVAQTVYEIRVNANTGMELCKGRMNVLLSTNFELSPTGTLNCLILGNMDVATLFGGKANVAKRNDDMKRFPYFGKIVRAQNPASLGPGLAIFNPPKPSLIGPLIQDASVYEDFVMREPSQVQGVSKAGENYQSAGEWFIQVHAINQTHRPETYTGSLQFDKVIKWEIKAAGFDNAPKMEFMAFESMTFFWNTNPIAVPEIQIKTKLSDLPTSNGVGGGGLGGIGDMIFSGITIQISLIEHNPI